MGMAYGEPFGGRHGSISDAATRFLARPWRTVDTQHLWRVEAVSYSTVIDAEREEYGSTAPRLELFLVSIKHWTPCGARLLSWRSYGPVWVDLRSGAKQWASRTPEEALRQFELRRRKQINILKRQLLRAERELVLALEANTIKEPA